MTVLPIVRPFGPFLFGLDVIRRVSGQSELGGASLAVMAGGAAELLDRVRAVGVHKQIEPGMGAVLLDIGFRPDIERILRRCPAARQTLLLSATMPPPVLHLARRYMRDPVLLNLVVSRDVAYIRFLNRIPEQLAALKTR